MITLPAPAPHVTTVLLTIIQISVLRILPPVEAPRVRRSRIGCTSCPSGTCAAVSCSANFFNDNDDATDGCEGWMPDAHQRHVRHVLIELALHDRDVQRGIFGFGLQRRGDVHVRRPVSMRAWL